MNEPGTEPNIPDPFGDGSESQTGPDYEQALAILTDTQGRRLDGLRSAEGLSAQGRDGATRPVGHCALIFSGRGVEAKQNEGGNHAGR